MIFVFQAEHFSHKRTSPTSDVTQPSVKSRKQLKVDTGLAAEALLELTSDMTEHDTENEHLSAVALNIVHDIMC